MSLSASARYQFGATIARFLPQNPDTTIGGVLLDGNAIRIVGATGTYDVSGVADDSAIPMTIKFDTGTEETKTVDLSGAASASAVTQTELVAAVTTSAFTNLTISEESATSRPLLVPATPGTIAYMQVYGELAEIIGLGYGLGMQFIKVDTTETFDDSILRKDDETITATDNNGIDVDVITDGYRKGATYTIVDDAGDYSLRSLIEGGDVADGIYTPPNMTSTRRYFYMEIFNPTYAQGTNKQADIVGYNQVIAPSCKGTFGDRSRSRDFVRWNYIVEATTYTDIGGTFRSDSREPQLSVAAYGALEVETT